MLLLGRRVDLCPVESSGPEQADTDVPTAVRRDLEGTDAAGDELEVLQVGRPPVTFTTAPPLVDSQVFCLSSEDVRCLRVEAAPKPLMLLREDENLLLSWAKLEPDCLAPGTEPLQVRLKIRDGTGVRQNPKHHHIIDVVSDLGVQLELPRLEEVHPEEVFSEPTACDVAGHGVGTVADCTIHPEPAFLPVGSKAREATRGGHP